MALFDLVYFLVCGGLLLVTACAIALAVFIVMGAVVCWVYDAAARWIAGVR